MTHSISSVFSPLSKDYCMFFYYFSIYGFVGFMISLMYMFLVIVLEKYTWNFKFALYLFYLACLPILYFVIYFQNRLLYSICIK